MDLFLGFLKVGCFAFGGAYSAIPLIRDVVLDHGWLTIDELAGMIAISESTPGPIMVNLATYVGSAQAGLPGALLATLAVVLPSFWVILLVMSLLKTFTKNPYVQAVLRGLKPCIAGIILATGLSMVILHCFPAGIRPDLPALLMTVMLVAAMLGYQRIRKKKLSPIALLMLSALLGILIL